MKMNRGKSKKNNDYIIYYQTNSVKVISRKEDNPAQYQNLNPQRVPVEGF